MKTWHLIVETDRRFPAPGTWPWTSTSSAWPNGTPRTFLRFYQWERPDRVPRLLPGRRQGRRRGLLRRQRHRHRPAHDRGQARPPPPRGDLRRGLVRPGRLHRDPPRVVPAHLPGPSQGPGRCMGLSARLAEIPPPAYIKGTMPCFAFPARDEIEIGGRKIVGSAQKRAGRALPPARLHPPREGRGPPRRRVPARRTGGGPGHDLALRGARAARRFRRRRRAPRPGLRRVTSASASSASP